MDNAANNGVIEKRNRGRPRIVTDPNVSINSSEAKKIYNQRFFEKNREKILNAQKCTVVCECGIEIRKNILDQHFKSRYHMSIMKNTKDKK